MKCLGITFSMWIDSETNHVLKVKQLLSSSVDDIILNMQIAARITFLKKEKKKIKVFFVVVLFLKKILTILKHAPTSLEEFVYPYLPRASSYCLSSFPRQILSRLILFLLLRNFGGRKIAKIFFWKQMLPINYGVCSTNIVYSSNMQPKPSGAILQANGMSKYNQGNGRKPQSSSTTAMNSTSTSPVML